ncbi:hypothetical protein RIF29_17361 [Crotalaria pallida]|uniref:Uncharacterized protein n=1 Tax=Crotalaria pallida TaxID=3830 RepID=A0AAN9FH55_CROPI
MAKYFCSSVPFVSGNGFSSRSVNQTDSMTHIEVKKGKQKGQAWRSLWFATVWSIWLMCNDVIFSNATLDIIQGPAQIELFGSSSRTTPFWLKSLVGCEDASSSTVPGFGVVAPVNGSGTRNESRESHLRPCDLPDTMSFRPQDVCDANKPPSEPTKGEDLVSITTESGEIEGGWHRGDRKLEEIEGGLQSVQNQPQG